jgi:hypothetical protein
LIFGSPIPGYAAPQDTVAPAHRVPLLLGSLLDDLVTDDPPVHEELPAAVERALDPVRAVMPPGVPADLMVRGLMAWTYLFGALSAELFGHRHNVVADFAVSFDHEVGRLAKMLGLVGPGLP